MENKPGGRPTLAMALAVVLLIGGCSLIANLGGGHHDDGDASEYVKIACHDWVKERLKSPGSAHFSGDQVDRVGERYTVRGAVDSDNSFGASVRNTYTCVADNHGGSSQLVSLVGLSN